MDILFCMQSSHEVTGPHFDKCGKGGSGCALCYLICVPSKPLTVPCPGSDKHSCVCVVAGSGFRPVFLYNRGSLRDSAEVLAFSTQDVQLHHEEICTKLSGERKNVVKENTMLLHSAHKLAFGQRAN